MFIQKLSTILSGNRQFFALHAKLNNFEELREKFLNCFGVWNTNGKEWIKTQDESSHVVY